MGTALVTVHLSGYGQAWDNTWALKSSTEPDGPISDEEIETLSDDALPFLSSLAGTNPADGGYGGASSPVIAILGFMRAITPAAVSLTGVLINDGATPGSKTGPFWSQSFLIPCLAETPTAVTVAPLSIALLMNRSTNEIGVKPGRLYLRAVLQDAEVYPGSRVGVTFTDGSAQTAMVTRANTAVDDSLLVNWTPLAEGDPSFVLAIPHYGSEETDDAGQVISGSFITSISVNKPVSRQMTRGRRRPAPPAP